VQLIYTRTLLWFSKTSLKHLIPLIIKSYLVSWNIMVFVAKLWSGLKVIFLVTNNLFNLIQYLPLTRLLNVASLKVLLFKDHCFFILYINYLPHAFQLTQHLLFADDTSIFYSHSDPERGQSVFKLITNR